MMNFIISILNLIAVLPEQFLMCRSNRCFDDIATLGWWWNIRRFNSHKIVGYFGCQFTTAIYMPAGKLTIQIDPAAMASSMYTMPDALETTARSRCRETELKLRDARSLCLPQHSFGLRPANDTHMTDDLRRVK
jgi:hypothetical protein